MKLKKIFDLDSIQYELSKGRFEDLRGMINKIPPFEIALLIESSTPDNRAILWQIIDEDLEGEILSNLSEEVREMILSFMTVSYTHPTLPTRLSV